MRNCAQVIHELPSERTAAVFREALRLLAPGVLQGVAVCCSVLQGVAVFCEALRLLAPGVLQCVVVCCRILQCVAGCCSVS